MLCCSRCSCTSWCLARGIGRHLADGHAQRPRPPRRPLPCGSLICRHRPHPRHPRQRCLRPRDGHGSPPRHRHALKRPANCPRPRRARSRRRSQSCQHHGWPSRPRRSRARRPSKAAPWSISPSQCAKNALMRRACSHATIVKRKTSVPVRVAPTSRLVNGLALCRPIFRCPSAIALANQRRPIPRWRPRSRTSRHRPCSRPQRPSPQAHLSGGQTSPRPNRRHPWCGMRWCHHHNRRRPYRSANRPQPLSHARRWPHRWSLRVRPSWTNGALNRPSVHRQLRPRRPHVPWSHRRQRG